MIKNDKFAEIVRAGLAYAFAALPEGVHLIEHYTNSSHKMGKGWINGFAHLFDDDNKTTTAMVPPITIAPPAVATTAPPVTALPPTQAPAPGVPATTAAAVPTTVAPVPATTAPFMPAITTAAAAPAINSGGTFAPGPNVKPLGSKRRLEHKDEEDEEPHREIHTVKFSFKEGLPYQVDDKLMRAMIKQGQFENLASDHDGPIEILSYSIRHMDPPKKQAATAAQLSLYAIGGSVLLGMMVFAVRRRGGILYQQVDTPATAQE
jgi:hypothetical protein